jgi:hypothetical protein
MAEVTPDSLAFLEIIKPAPEASDLAGLVTLQTGSWWQINIGFTTL